MVRQKKHIASCSLHYILLIILHIVSFSRVCSYSGIHYTRRGDLNIGGLVPLHHYNETSQQCGTLRTIGALKRLEAMVYAVDWINANTSLLPNITLGFEIFDTCSSNAVTLRDCLNFIPPQRWTGNCSSCGLSDSCPENLPRIVGVVGAQRSGSSVQAAILLGLYQIPQVSYLSTSDELNNVYRYPYFLRTVGPDSFQVAAIVDILVEYGWNYVSFINSDDTYGKSAQQEFRRRAQEQKICTAITRTVSLYETDKTFDELVEELLTLQTKSHAIVVILFVQLEMAKDIFDSATRAGANRRFIWIGSDGWGNYGDDAVRGNENATIGAFTVSPLSGKLESFDHYFHSLNTTSTNPWLLEFLETYTDCSPADTGNQSCDRPGLIGQADDGQTSHETLVIDSVFTFAYALDRMRRDNCRGVVNGLCPNMIDIDGNVLLKYLKKTEFESLANGWISFTEEGNMYGRYAVNHLQSSNSTGKYSFVLVGEWKQSLEANISNLRIATDVPWYLWDGASINNDTGIPRSVCSFPCQPGQKINRIPDNLCCWTCTPCEKSEIVINNGTQCESCIDIDNKKFGWPNEDQSACVDIPSDFILSDQPWAITILSVASICIAATVFFMGIYIRNQEMPLIKASSRELSYIIFVGIIMSYVTAIFFSLAPSPFVCVLRRLGPNIATSLIYASIATKTIRLYRIFRASKKSAKRPNYIGSMFQVALSLIVTTLAVIWTVVWLCVDPPKVVLEMPNEKENKLQVTCHLNIIETVGVMVWDVALVIVCCIFAFMTRKLPENYNETRFITFCSFCTLVVFVTFSPIYFTSREPYYQASYYSAGLIINATVTLTCLFAVKIYALYFVDEDEMNIFTQTRLKANTKTASTRGMPPPNITSSTTQNEVHSNPTYVTEADRDTSMPMESKSNPGVNLNEPKGNRYRSNSDNSNKGHNKPSNSTGVLERLSRPNKVDPDTSELSQKNNQIQRGNGITSPDRISKDPGPDTTVIFNPEVVEFDTHM